MTNLNKDAVLDALRAVRDPASGRDVVALGLIQGLVIKDGRVGFVLEVAAAQGQAMEPLRQACEAAVARLPGVEQVTAVLTAERAGDDAPAAPEDQGPPPKRFGGHGTPGGGKIAIPGVANVIAVASGKGGVGKSTTAVNLAVALTRMGLKVGLMDADIYGPSVPRMLGLSTKPASNADNKIVPHRAHGLVAMSIGFMLEEDQPVIWRGPMVMGAVQQLLSDVAWDTYGPLDVLVVDMPPGTGDAQLTLAQRVDLKGAVIVSTPQDIALIDARKGIAMFQRVQVPVLGIIENMSTFLCPHCGGESHIFGHGGARDTAAQWQVPFLGEIPLTMAIRETSDAGTPIAASAPDSPQAQAYGRVAAAVAAALHLTPAEA